MGVDVDESRKHGEPVRVDHPLGTVGRVDVTDDADPPVGNGHVGTLPRAAGAVDDDAAAHDKVPPHAVNP